MIHIEADNNRKEDTDMWINRENNKIKNSHVKEEMSNRITSIEVGSYCTAASFLSIDFFAPTHCVLYFPQNSLPLTVFAVITTRFAALTTTKMVS